MITLSFSHLVNFPNKWGHPLMFPQQCSPRSECCWLKRVWWTLCGSVPLPASYPLSGCGWHNYCWGPLLLRPLRAAKLLSKKYDQQPCMVSTQVDTALQRKGRAGDAHTSPQSRQTAFSTFPDTDSSCWNLGSWHPSLLCSATGGEDSKLDSAQLPASLAPIKELVWYGLRCLLQNLAALTSTGLSVSRWETYSSSRPGFLHLGTIGIWKPDQFMLGVCPVHSSMFSQ